mgnify:CR=1 FL=1
MSQIGVRSARVSCPWRDGVVQFPAHAAHKKNGLPMNECKHYPYKIDTMQSAPKVTVFASQNLHVTDSALGRPPAGERHIPGSVVAFSDDALDGVPAKQCTLVAKVQCGATEDCLLPVSVNIPGTQESKKSWSWFQGKPDDGTLVPFVTRDGNGSHGNMVATFHTIGRQFVLAETWWLCLPNGVHTPRFHAATWSVVAPGQGTKLSFCSPESAKMWCVVPIQGLGIRSGILTARIENSCPEYSQGILWPFKAAYTQQLASEIAKKMEYGHVYPQHKLTQGSGSTTRLIHVPRDDSALGALYGGESSTLGSGGSSYSLYVVASTGDLQFETINMLPLETKADNMIDPVSQTSLKGLIVARNGCDDLVRSLRPLTTSPPTLWTAPDCSSNPGPCVSIGSRLGDHLLRYSSV